MDRSELTVDEERLARVLGRPALQRLVSRLREQLARDPNLRRSFRLAEVSDAERDAIEALVGRSPGRGRSISVSLARLDQTLREADIAPGLVVALEALGGPLVDPRVVATEVADAWQAALLPTRAWIDEQLDEHRRVGLERWLHALEAEGLLKRLAVDPPQAEVLLHAALRVLTHLQEPRDLTLAELAAKATGDAHGLDVGRPLCTLVQRAISVMTDDVGSREESETDGEAAFRRRLWGRVGVSIDALGTSALVFGLRGEGDGLVDRLLELHADAGEPCRLTEQQLQRYPPCFARPHHATLPADGGRLIFVCENPAVVAAASRELRQSPLRGALICTEGQPSTAVRLLLENLQQAGATILAHADFDAAGIQIVELLVSRHGALPWRFDAASYLAAVGQVREGSFTGASLLPELSALNRRSLGPGNQLAAAMDACGVAIHEELIVDALLGDLAPTEQTLERRPARKVRGLDEHARRCPRAAWLAWHHPAAAEDMLSPSVREHFARQRREVERRYWRVVGASGAPREADVVTRVLASRHPDMEAEVELLAARWLDAEARGQAVHAAKLVHLGADCPLASDSLVRAGLVVEDVTRAVRQRLRLVAARRVATGALLQLSAEPALPIGPWCRHRDQRRACRFVGHCFQAAGVTSPSVFDLPRGGEHIWGLFRGGVSDLAQLRDEHLLRLSPRQRRHVQAVREDTLVLDQQALGEMLASWPRPWSYLDFETFNAPLPTLNDVPPLGVVPFAAAVCDSDDRPPRALVSVAMDPRPELAAWLVSELEGATSGSLIAYNAPFEAARLRELARACPEHAATLRRLRTCLVDARAAVEACVSHPDFRGRFDLKTVSKVLLGGRRSDEIADGLAAQAAYAGLVADHDRERTAAIKRYVADDVLQLRGVALWLRGHV